MACFDARVGAAREQSPDLDRVAGDYAGRRRAELAGGAAAVTVHHVDLLALPPASLTSTGPAVD